MTTGLSASVAIEAAGDAVVIADIHGVIQTWNRAATRLFGHSPTDAVGETLALLIPPEHRARHMAAFHTAIDTGTLSHDGRPAGIEATHRAGHVVRAEMSLGVITGADGEPTGMIAVLRSTATERLSFV